MVPLSVLSVATQMITAMARPLAATEHPLDRLRHQLLLPQSVEPQAHDQRHVDQKIENHDRPRTEEQNPQHVALDVADLAGQIGRLVPSAVGQQDKDQSQARRSAGPLRCRREFGRRWAGQKAELGAAHPNAGGEYHAAVAVIGLATLQLVGTRTSGRLQVLLTVSTVAL